MSDKAKIVIVVAMARKTRAIGNKKELLWYIPEDLKRFKEKSLGHPVIMGRKTFESIVATLGKPLPGRTNIVVTHNPDYSFDGVIVSPSLEDALTKAQELGSEEIHIGGGANLYEQALPLVDELYVTYVDDEPEGDTFFPAFADNFTIVEEHEKRDHQGLSYQWIDYVRKRS